MKNQLTVLLNIVCGLLLVSKLQAADAPPPVYTNTAATSTVAPPNSSAAKAATVAAATPAPPPSAPPKLSAAELEKLLMPIALYPDPLLATLLPASVYPLEIVQAARFMADTNNLSKVDAQPWDDSVKAIAKIPAALKKMNDDLQWTIQLGEAFLNQDKDVMDMIQALRSKAQKAGTLQTTEQQTIVVTNMVVEKTVEQQVVTVTNTVVQIQPSNPQTVYVPSYPPTVYYPPPAYVYDPLAPLVTFTAGVAMGAIIANNCDWHHGGCYWGGGDVDIDVDRNTNINVDRSQNNINNRTSNRTSAQGTSGKKWQPDQNRVRSSGSAASARTMESRGWSSGSTGAAGARPSATPATANRGQGAAANRGQGPAASQRPAGGGGLSSAPGSGARPSASPSVGGGNRPSASPSASPSISGGNRSAGASPSVSSAGARSSGSSAFSGGGASQQSASQRGSASRGSAGGGGGGGRAGGGGGRGGGGRR